MSFTEHEVEAMLAMARAALAAKDAAIEQRVSALRNDNMKLVGSLKQSSKGGDAVSTGAVLLRGAGVSCHMLPRNDSHYCRQSRPQEGAG